MRREPTLDELWEAAEPPERAFSSDLIAGLPGPARRYLEHAIARGTPLATAVRLRMHGEIKLGSWYPFTAEQVIVRGGEMIWRATARVHGLPVRGSDRLVGGEGAMRWKLFGIVPVVAASGPDVTRSAAGRVEGETVWLPSALCGDDVSWSAPDASHATAALSLYGEPAALTLELAEHGRLEALRYSRWGNPEGGEFHYSDFGGVVEEEGTFDGYTVPTRMRAGWYFGTPRFEDEGEFFRVTVDEAAYR